MKTKLSQQEFGFVRWGGKRRGAGRKPKGERAGVSHAKRPVLASRHAVLMRALESATRESFRVVEYSVQSNHLHLIVESEDEGALGRGMIGLSVRIARGLNKLWRRQGSVFSDRYHARILRTPREVRNALVYVIMNARKHDAWRVQRADPYSSGAWFEGWSRSAFEREAPWNPADSSPRFLARARTWLLSVGWQRHGRIDLRECPAAA